MKIQTSCPTCNSYVDAKSISSSILNEKLRLQSQEVQLKEAILSAKLTHKPQLEQELQSIQSRIALCEMLLKA